MPWKPNKFNIIKPKRNIGGNSGNGGLGTLTNFTNVQDIKARFFTNTQARRQAGDKASGDATYWTEGRCNWGGSHNLLEDCQTLATWANNIVSTQHDVQELTLAINEQEFNTRKQTLINKYQDCINKCQISSSCSIGNICCIWNDYFGSFVSPFTSQLKQNLQSKLNELQAINPTHQKEIVELEAELREAETKCKDALAQAAKETDPAKKAQFIAIAQATERTIKQLKVRISRNPLSRLAEYSHLNDIGRFLDGNVPSSLPPRNPNPLGISNPNQSNRNNINGSNVDNNPWNPFLGSTENPNNQPINHQQLLIFAVIAIVTVFFLLNKEKQANQEYYD